MDVDHPHFASVSDPLRAIIEQVETEMNSCALPMLEDTLLTDLKPFSGAAINHLPTLVPLMSLGPHPLVTQFSKDQPIPRVGTHRVAVAELMAQLLRAECPAVGAAVAATGLLPLCMDLSLDHPTNSSIQCATLRSLRSALSPGCGGLRMWEGVVIGGVPGRVAAIAGGAQGVAVGLRPAHAGFAISVAELLCLASTGKVPIVAEASAASVVASSDDDEEEEQEQEGGGEGGAKKSIKEKESITGSRSVQKKDSKQEEEPTISLTRGNAANSNTNPTTSTTTTTEPPPRTEWQKELAATLEGMPAWASFAADQGTLANLLAVQNMELGGPRPVRLDAAGEMEAELAALGGSGQMISGQELLALLRGLSFGRMS